MLFDFYQQQASKQPLCAIYLISGLQEIQAGPRLNGYANDNGNDDHIPSSPFMSSSIPQHIEERRSLSKVITLVGEDHLDGMRACSTQHLIHSHLEPNENYSGESQVPGDYFYAYLQLTARLYPSMRLKLSRDEQQLTTAEPTNTIRHHA